MSSPIGSSANPLRVAVFGSGPAGFYACEELLKQEDVSVKVDLFDRLPTPFGLVRGGVAPDHQKIKSVTRLFDRTAGREGFRFMGNVAFGTDIDLGTVLGHYHQALFCTGAEADRRMGIPGEDLPGSHPATEFVAWYNGHPDYRDKVFDLSVESVAVVGNGNVAMDVARILARPVDELAKTDIADYALDALRKSRIKTIYLLGRRGPAQAAFTNPEIRELCDMQEADLVLRAQDLKLDEVNSEFLAEQKDPVHKRNLEALNKQLEKGEGNQEKKIRALFFVSPVELSGEGHLQKVKLEKNRLLKDDKGGYRARGTGEFEEIEAQMIFRSIGYKGTPLPDLPFNDSWGVIPNDDGRVTDESGEAMPRLYVAGWIKRGPSGVIGTNKPCSIGTVRNMLADLPSLSQPDAFAADEGAILKLLHNKGVKVVNYEEWKQLDAMEVERGKSQQRPRNKFTTVSEMLVALKK